MASNILTLEPGPGGVPALARAVYKLLEDAGHSPRIIYRATDEVPTSSRWAVLKHLLTTPPRRQQLKEDMQAVTVVDYPVPPRYQYRLLQLAGPTLSASINVVVSGSSHVGLPLALAKRPYVLWVATLYEDELRGRAMAGDAWATGLLRHPDWSDLQRQERLVYERASLILGLSPHTTHQIADRWPALQAKLRTVGYPTDTVTFCPGPGSTEPPSLLLTARIRDPRKNASLLLRTFARVRAEFPRLRLVIAGDEPPPALQALVAELGLGHSITFAGYVHPSELVLLYQKATLFVFPSLQEGLGISVLDAMACGVPVVSTRCGGPEGLIRDGLTGLLVANNDETAFAEAILDLLRHPDRARAMGFAGRELTTREYSRARVNEQLRSALNDVFGKVI